MVTQGKLQISEDNVEGKYFFIFELVSNVAKTADFKHLFL